MKIEIRCNKCGKHYFVSKKYAKSKRNNNRCMSCAMKSLRRENSPHWKGGSYEDNGKGYRRLCLQHDDPFVEMADKSRVVLEHRYVMAQKLNRILKPTECVHHVNGDKKDNRPGNLTLIPRGSHLHLTKLQVENHQLRNKIKYLEIELNEYKKISEEKYREVYKGEG